MFFQQNEEHVISSHVQVNDLINQSIVQINSPPEIETTSTSAPSCLNGNARYQTFLFTWDKYNSIN